MGSTTSANALALAARGVAGMIANAGHMRLVVGCTLNPPEVEAIRKGHDMRALVEAKLVTVPLDPPDEAARQGLELLAWMIGSEEHTSELQSLRHLVCRLLL